MIWENVKGLFEVRREVIAPRGVGESVRAPHFKFEFECHRPDGSLVWRRSFPNLVTDVGANFALDTLFSGSGYTAGWFMGLVSSASFSAYANADTMASHGGWLELTSYNEATRPAVAFAAADSRSKATSAACVFTSNALATAKGAFVATNSTKGGTTGTLYNVGNFTEGDAPLASGYVLSATGTWSFT